MESPPNVTLSFCITYYNEGALLNELIEAILAQEDPPEEILIYDDASTIPPRDLPVSNRIRLIRGKTNLGPAHGRNKMLALASGEFIHFHDADDLITLGWTRAIRRALINSSADCVFCESLRIGSNGRISENCAMFSILIRDEDLLDFSLNYGILPATGTYRTSLVRSVGGYPTYWQSEDYAFHIRLSLASPRFVVLTQPLVIIRLRPDGRSILEPRRVFADAIQILKDVRPSLPKNYYGIAGHKVFSVARTLFNLGDEVGAAEGFALATKFCARPWKQQPAHYRLAANAFGPIVAERMGRIFRRAAGRGA